MKAPAFAYARAASIEDACALLAQHGEDARILAGGQSLMPTLNMRLSAPSVLIDINRIAALAGISVESDYLRIGALVRHAEVLRSALVRRHAPLIAAAMPYVAHPAVRNRGTFGGSIALADPAAELPACALALEARFALASVGGTRVVEASDFFKGLYATALRSDEILVETRIPVRPTDEVVAFQELARRHGDFAIVGIAATARRAGATLNGLRLVFFGCEDRPVLAKATAALAYGRAVDDDLIAAMRETLDLDLDPVGNIQGSRETKLHLAGVLLGRVMHALAAR